MTCSEFDAVNNYLVDIASCIQCKHTYRVSGSIMYCRIIEIMLGIEDNPTEDARVYDDSMCNLFVHWRS
jgi:hypothetical protein